MNINPRKYNCGGYALGTKTWYRPFEGFGGYSYFYRTDRENRKKVRRLAEFMCTEFDDLRMISSLKDLKKDEYAIAFRISKNEMYNDFHFIKRNRNGHWYEKCGCDPYIDHISKKEVFSDNWHGIYFGQIILLAKKFQETA